MKKTEMLKKNYEFKTVLSKGKFYKGIEIEIFILKNNKKRNFLGIAIGTKNGKAYQSTNDPRGGKTAQSRGLCISDRNNLYRA